VVRVRAETQLIPDSSPIASRSVDRRLGSCRPEANANDRQPAGKVETGEARRTADRDLVRSRIDNHNRPGGQGRRRGKEGRDDPQQMETTNHSALAAVPLLTSPLRGRRGRLLVTSRAK